MWFVLEVQCPPLVPSTLTSSKNKTEQSIVMFFHCHNYFCIQYAQIYGFFGQWYLFFSMYEHFYGLYTHQNVIIFKQMEILFRQNILFILFSLFIVYLQSFYASLVLYKDHRVCEMFFQLCTCTQRVFLGLCVCFRVQYINSIRFSLSYFCASFSVEV